MALKAATPMPAAALPTDEPARLAALHAERILDTAPEAAFDRLATLAARITRSPISLLTFVDAERQWSKARIGLEMVEVPRAYSFCAHAILDPGRPLVVPDTAADPRFADNPLVAGPMRLRFYAGAPVISPEGQPLGTLCVMDHRPRSLAPDQEESLTGLARMAGSILGIRRAVAELRRGMQGGGAEELALAEALDRASAQVGRHGVPVSLLRLDLPAFRRLLERPGPAPAARILRELGASLADGLQREAWRPQEALTSARGGW